MLNNFSPLPLNEEPLFISIPPLTNNEPLKVEPLSIEVTTNPLLGATDAVTEPLTTWNASPVKLENGISNKLIPLPLNEPV